jgi:hypothetical protein
LSYLNYSPDLSIPDRDPQCNRWQEEEDVVEGSEFDPLLNYIMMIKNQMVLKLNYKLKNVLAMLKGSVLRLNYT